MLEPYKLTFENAFCRFIIGKRQIDASHWEIAEYKHPYGRHDKHEIISQLRFPVSAFQPPTANRIGTVTLLFFQVLYTPFPLLILFDIFRAGIKIYGVLRERAGFEQAANVGLLFFQIGVQTVKHGAGIGMAFLRAAACGAGTVFMRVPL